MTLLELLVALLVSGAIVISLSTAFTAAANFERQAPRVRLEEADARSFEDTLSRLIRKAFVTTDPEDGGTYFIGRVASGNSDGLGTVRSDELIFTRLTGKPSGKALSSTQPDFELRNEELGPDGGLEEVAISLFAVGDPGDQSGLYLREQKPSDTDPDQGGYESVLRESVSEIFFEFYDGTNWQGTWDTTQGERALPLAVRVSYRESGDDEDGAERQVIVKLENTLQVAAAIEIGGARR